MKKIFKALFSICFIVVSIFSFSACGDKSSLNNDDSTPPPTSTPVEPSYPSEPSTSPLGPTDISFDGAISKDTQDLGSILYITSPNSKLVFSFSDYVKVSETSNWSVSFDITGNIPISSKTVSLDVGDNLYYVLVTSSNGNSKQYIVMIHRNAMFEVKFKTGTALTINPIIVEEGDYIQEPTVNLQMSMFEFRGWDYDFTKPVTSDLTIKAQWERVEEGSIPGTDVKILVHFRVISDEVEIDGQYLEFLSEIMVEQRTKIKDILALAEIENFMNDTIIVSMEDAENFIEECYGNEYKATFIKYYMREYPISNTGYGLNPSLEEETTGDYEVVLEFYELFITFELTNK